MADVFKYERQISVLNKQVMHLQNLTKDLQIEVTQLQQDKIVMAKSQNNIELMDYFANNNDLWQQNQKLINDAHIQDLAMQSQLFEISEQYSRLQVHDDQVNKLHERIIFLKQENEFNMKAREAFYDDQTIHYKSQITVLTQKISQQQLEILNLKKKCEYAHSYVQEYAGMQQSAIAYKLQAEQIQNELNTKIQQLEHRFDDQPQKADSIVQNETLRQTQITNDSLTELVQILRQRLTESYNLQELLKQEQINESDNQLALALEFTKTKSVEQLIEAFQQFKIQVLNAKAELQKNQEETSSLAKRIKFMKEKQIQFETENNDLKKQIQILKQNTSKNTESEESEVKLEEPKETISKALTEQDYIALFE
ncbi:Hypothetical_protein [Hexamita inflata]|uniref:Hypothetical_protein n=1 Tax=Hexamita inflata TaxID=28002 RepID=A0AA86PWS6_9EUKA|nr:Hypothetical protein HINF_LOCUS33926 [Hexamita inflata]